MKQNRCFVVVALTSQTVVGCSSQFDTCEARRTCALEGDAATDGGSAGEEAGNDTHDGGSAGDVDGAGGTAGDVDAQGGSTDRGERALGRCGDGNIDQDEKCDDGIDNGAGKACNSKCQPNVCGDGDKRPGEVCDDGAENGLELLRCAPDCSRIVQIKHIILAGNELPKSRLVPDPIATADATCPSGYKAFFAYGASRRATTTPLKAQNSVDWVIRPYTYYYNDDENPVWLTDSVPLLGVRNGMFTALENRISAATLIAVTGLNPDYTTLGTDNCQGWSSIQTGDSKRYGLPSATDARFMFSSDPSECGSNSIIFYCVEQ